MNEQENNSETTGANETESLVEAVNTSEVAASNDVVEEVAEIVAETSEEVKDDVIETTPSVEAGALAATATPLFLKIKTWVLARRYTIAAVVLVLIAILGLTYIMEEQGRIETGIFDGVSNLAASYKSVAVVNDGKITQKDLDISISQISAAASAQGADLADPEILNTIQTQALDMLVNTELLKQEAVVRGVAITDEDVQARLETLKTDVGGEEALQARMAEFGVEEKVLLRDIKNELTIQTLLDQVFEEKGVAVTEEEVKAFYDAAGGAKAGLPAIDEVRSQIETQLRTGKEQEVVTSFVEELRGKATIEILI